MKKTLILMTAMLLFGSVQQADAQKRKTTTRRTTTTHKTTVRRTTTLQKPAAPVQKFIKEVAFYDVKAKSGCIAVDKDYLYYVENSNNNAVIGIDRKTGELKTIINGIANVYEGRRPYINGIAMAGGRMMLKYDQSNPYIWKITGDNNKWITKEWERVEATNEKYAVIVLQSEDKELWDMEAMKFIARPGLPLGMETRYIIDSNGCVWWKVSGSYSARDFGVNCFNPGTGKKVFYSLSKESYVASEGIYSINWIRQSGDSLYVACKRRIYRMNMLQPGKWEEYAKVPPTVGNVFERFWVTSKGNLLTYSDTNSQRNVEFYRVGSFDNPQVLGRKAIETGMNQFGYDEIWPSHNVVLVDADDNFIVLDSGGTINIYNPDGVVGYEKARGRIIKL